MWESTRRGRQHNNDRPGGDLQYHPEGLHNNTGTQEGAASQGYRGNLFGEKLRNSQRLGGSCDDKNVDRQVIKDSIGDVHKGFIAL